MILVFVKGAELTEESLFDAIAQSGARALLIGRQALIALGLAVNTDDYDFWLHIEDVERFNAPLEALELFANRTPAEARGRYVIEGDEHIDVLIARVVPTTTGQRVAFDDVWQRRQTMQSLIHVPALEDLILTKRFGARPKDAEDIRQLEALLARTRQ